MDFLNNLNAKAGQIEFWMKLTGVCAVIGAVSALISIIRGN